MFKAYIYDSDNKTIIAQIDEILDLNFEESLNEIWVWSFSIYSKNPYANFNVLKEFRRVQIVEVKNNIDIILFDGVIRAIQWSIDRVIIRLNTFEYLLSRRLLLTDYNISGSVWSILTTLLSAINAQYDTNLILQNNLPTQTVTKKYFAGISFFDVLEDLANLWYEFKIEYPIIYFAENIWIDRTSWPNFFEFKYDVDTPADSNITAVQTEIDSRNFANWILSNDWENNDYQQDTISISEFWLIQEKATTNWDSSSTVNWVLQEKKERLEEFSVTPANLDYDFLKLWDLVKVFVNTWNEIVFIDENVKVLSKSYSWWDLPTININLAKWKITTRSWFNILREIQQKQNNLNFEVKNLEKQIP